MKYLNTREIRRAVLRSAWHWVRHPMLDHYRRERCPLCRETELAGRLVNKLNCAVCPVAYLHTRCAITRAGGALPWHEETSIWGLWYWARGVRRLFWAYVIVAGLCMLWIALMILSIVDALRIDTESYIIDTESYINDRAMRRAVLTTAWVRAVRLRGGGLHRWVFCPVCEDLQERGRASGSLAQSDHRCHVCPVGYFHHKCVTPSTYGPEYVESNSLSVYHSWTQEHPCARSSRGEEYRWTRRLFWNYVIVAGLCMLWVALVLLAAWGRVRDAISGR
jgi:hypothetical protein